MAWVQKVSIFRQLKKKKILAPPISLLFIDELLPSLSISVHSLIPTLKHLNLWNIHAVFISGWQKAAFWAPSHKCGCKHKLNHVCFDVFSCRMDAVKCVTEVKRLHMWQLGDSVGDGGGFKHVHHVKSIPQDSVCSMSQLNLPFFLYKYPAFLLQQCSSERQMFSKWQSVIIQASLYLLPPYKVTLPLRFLWCSFQDFCDDSGWLVHPWGDVGVVFQACVCVV